MKCLKSIISVILIISLTNTNLQLLGKVNNKSKQETCEPNQIALESFISKRKNIEKISTKLVEIIRNKQIQGKNLKLIY